MKLRARRDLKARRHWKLPENRYNTRRLMAGDEFEAPPSEALLLRKTRFAEEVIMPRRGRPPKATEPEPEPAAELVAAEPVAEETQSQSLEGHSVAELREMVQARGLELPDGYTRKDELIAMLEGGAET